jgi:hypothetical protein
MKSNSYKKLFLVFSIFFTFQFIFPETVILNNEEVIRGKVNSQDATFLKMTDESGKNRIISKTEILKVVYRDVKDKAELDKIIKEEKEKKGLKPTKVADKRDKKQLLWRSALIPGWGQWKAGRKKDTYFTLAAFAIAGAVVLSTRSSLITEQDAVESQGRIFGIIAAAPNSPLDQNQKLGLVFFSNTQSTQTAAKITSYNLSISIFGVIYFAQLTRTYFIGKEWEKEPETKTAVLPSGKMLNTGFNFNMKQEFSANQIGSRETYYDFNYVHTF